MLLDLHVLGYLPQRVSEFSGIAIGVGVAVGLLPALFSGRSSSVPAWSAGRVRLLAIVGLLVAAGFATLGFVTDAEPRGGLPGGPWGSHSDKLVFAVFVLLVACIAGWNLAREIRFLRGERNDARRRAP